MKFCLHSWFHLAFLRKAPFQYEKRVRLGMFRHKATTETIHEDMEDVWRVCSRCGKNGGFLYRRPIMPWEYKLYTDKEHNRVQLV